MPKFTISILSYTNLAGAKACIDSVLRHSGNDYELWLHDNGGSAAGITAFFDDLAKKYPQIKVTHTDTNLGFIDPNNAAFDRCTSEYFVLLNDDVIISAGWLDKLEVPFKQFPTAALSGPEGGCTALLPNFHGTQGAFEFLEGSVLAVKVSAVRKIGPLFSPYLRFAYSEDSDLSLRCREQGLTLHKVKLQYTHKRSVTSARVHNVRIYQEMNHAACRRRWAHYLKVRRMDYPIILKRADAWGDVLLTTPIVRQLKKQFPVSPIWVETNCTDVFKGNPHVARCERSFPPNREARYIDLNGVYENTVNTPIIDAYARQAGLTEFDRQLDIAVESSPRPIPENTIAVHAGPSCWRSKNLSRERWIEIITELAAKHSVALVGHTDWQLPHTSGLDLRGKTNLQQLAGVLKKCRALVTIDSLPLHVAQAVGCPVVGLFSVSSPEYIFSKGPSIGIQGTGPSAGLRHRSPGTRVVDDGGQCIDTITTEQILNAVNEILISCSLPV